MSTSMGPALRQAVSCISSFNPTPTGRFDYNLTIIVQRRSPPHILCALPGPQLLLHLHSPPPPAPAWPGKQNGEWERKGLVFLAWCPRPLLRLCSGQSMIHAGLFALEDSFEGSLESTLLGVARSGVSYPGRNSSCWLSGAPHWEPPLILAPSCPTPQPSGQSPFCPEGASPF